MYFYITFVSSKIKDMKKLSITILTAVTVALAAFTPAKIETYKVDVQKSTIAWTGKKVMGQHSGELKLSSGTIVTTGSVPTKGGFVIDMTSLSNTDLPDAESKGKLLGHLKSEDFFGVEKYPSAQFVATKITAAGAGKVNVSGNLTIKGITNPISFPATYTVAGNTLTATAQNVKVDRTKYSIKYGSKSFFESIGDKAIDDEFILNISLVASK
jgi:polyisoprenoid-binding protein YceI